MHFQGSWHCILWWSEATHLKQQPWKSLGIVWCVFELGTCIEIHFLGFCRCIFHHQCLLRASCHFGEGIGCCYRATTMDLRCGVVLCSTQLPTCSLQSLTTAVMPLQVTSFRHDTLCRSWRAMTKEEEVPLMLGTWIYLVWWWHKLLYLDDCCNVVSEWPDPHIVSNPFFH